MPAALASFLYALHAGQPAIPERHEVGDDADRAAHDLVAVVGALVFAQGAVDAGGLEEAQPAVMLEFGPRGLFGDEFGAMPARVGLIEGVACGR